MFGRPALLPLAAGLLLQACAKQAQEIADAEPAAPVTPVAVAPPPPPLARTAAEFDTTTSEQRAAALAAEDDGAALIGTTVASLGDPTEPGLWLRTPLVDAATSGRVEVEGSDASARLDLIPAEGGSRLSLAAMRLLGVGLTDLPTVRIYAR